MAVLSNYITLTKDGWSEALPPYAEGLCLVAKADGTNAFQIDVVMGHDPNVDFSTITHTLMGNISSSSGNAFLYFKLANTNDTLPYLGYHLDSGTDPEYVRIYFRISKR